MLHCTGNSKDECAAPDTEERQCCYNFHLVLLGGKKAILREKSITFKEIKHKADLLLKQNEKTE